MKKIKISIMAVTVVFLTGAVNNIYAKKGAGVDPAVTIMNMDAPRSSALGNAFTAVADDIAALNHNPASLATLNTSQAMFHYNKGVFNDNSGRIAAGIKLHQGVLGFGVARYSAGDANLYDGVNAPRTVTAQSDTLVNFGYGRNFNALSLGANVKFLRSELAEQATANAMMADVGVNFPITTQLRLGLSAPVISGSIKYNQTSEDLPRFVRAGAAYRLPTQQLGRTLSSVLITADAPYSVGEEAFYPSLGVETGFGLMSLRAGYQWGDRMNGFSVGTGFTMNSLTMDYSFGFVSDNAVSSLQKVSLSYRFNHSGAGDSYKPVLSEIPAGQKPLMEVINEYRRGSVGTVSGH